MKQLNDRIAIKPWKRINQTEYNLVRDLSILGNPVYLEVPRRQFHCQKCQKYISERLSFMRLRQHHTIRYEWEHLIYASE
ncbi:hypothetical protein MAESPC_01115 [Microcystis aeruginosa SPC777]|uniref:Transposase IS204/IS1001/IS1096/IS1165 zinc-finger domain-containing protein n=1 Tax=Microcystis aeruginosa SPC777 TaxID=482300 RepID=S3JH00_MICAE|nr:hypothetical protein MAESPC_01115 [Microcystis aeruginosa SPC777]